MNNELLTDPHELKVGDWVSYQLLLNNPTSTVTTGQILRINTTYAIIRTTNGDIEAISLRGLRLHPYYNSTLMRTLRDAG